MSPLRCGDRVTDGLHVPDLRLERVEAALVLSDWLAGRLA